MTFRSCLPMRSVLGVVMLGGVLAAAGKPPSNTPVTVTFRCPGTAECTTSDRIFDDGLGSYHGTPATRTQLDEGPFLDGPSDLWFPLQPGYGRFVRADFSVPVSATTPPPCASANSCKKNFTSVMTDNSIPASITNPLDAAGSELPNGFLSIAVGQSARSRYMLNFADPGGRDILWTVRFNSAAYPGSTELTVTRMDANTWVVEATASDTAELVAVSRTGKNVMTHEGFYKMPFKLTVVR